MALFVVVSVVNKPTIFLLPNFFGFYLPSFLSVLDVRHPFLCWLHFSHQDYLLADSCVICDPHPKKGSSLKAAMNFIHSLASVIL